MGFCTAVTAKKILAKCGDKNVHETVGGSGRDYITILGVGCADGTRLPPFVVYKGKNLWSRWMQGGPAGCMYSVSDSGWMESANFVQWFEKMFLPATKHVAKKLPVILFFDGHHSHLSIKLIELARAHNVHLFCFPPHCTHILQPLDVAVFGPVKAARRKVLKEHQLETCAASITKEDFPMLLSKLWERSFRPQHLVSGFYRCGLCPVSREAVSSHKLSTALPHTKPHDVEPPPTITVEMTGKCTVGNAVTPIRLHLRGYFSSLLQKNKPQKGQAADKRKAKPRFYGEALTLDEVYERVSEEQRQKEAKAASKTKTKGRSKGNSRNKASSERKVTSKSSSPKYKRTGRYYRKLRRSTAKPPTPTPSDSGEEESVDSSSSAEDTEDDGVCEECGGCFKDDSKSVRSSWMGCDNCDRWFHYQCLDLTSIPDGFWSCKYCS